MALMKIADLQRHYEMTSGVVKALDGINIDIEEGERIVLLGPSGSGKTTLLNCVAALDSPTAGSYSFDGKEVPRENSEEMTTFRRNNIGYVFQFFNLLQDLTVLENILLIQELGGSKDQERATELLKLVGLEGEVNRFPGEISGGQQQRVAIARALIGQPDIIIADEPTSALDEANKQAFIETLLNECRKRRSTLIFVSHDTSLKHYFNHIHSLSKETSACHY